MSFLSYDTVTENHKQEALRHLQKRVEKGEKVEDILKIDNKYYRDKMVAGIVPMSYDIYNRIMQCSHEDGID